MADRCLNLSAYRFVEVTDAAALRDRLHTLAHAAGLRGTVILAPEGINLFLAGDEPALRGWLAQLREDARFAALDAKENWSAQQPFRFLRVKVKREIIRMNQPQVQPAVGRAPVVDAATLARWLDQGHDDNGRALVMLDTRNAFELEHGAFDGALDWRLSKFSDFPAALAAHRDALQGRTVVTYCTGGIRCEKAALAMQGAGVANVWQLDGGILRYLETMRDAPHWHGRCFVFDERESLDPQLQGLAE